MNDDLIERLRGPATVFYEYDADEGALLREAADAIERLTQERDALVRDLADWVTHSSDLAARVETLKSKLSGEKSDDRIRPVHEEG